MARLGGLSPSTVKRFEEGATPTHRTISAYVSALRSAAASHPITKDEAALLLALWSDAGNAPRRQDECAALNLDILPEGRTAAVRSLVRELSEQGYPGGIIDRLGFIHALNWPVMALLGLDPSDDRLGSWLGWHMLGVRPSLLGEAGPMPPSDALPLWVMAFFRLVRPYLFTPQAGALVDRLCQHSPNGFGPGWRAATSFLIAHPAGQVVRVIPYEDGHLVSHLPEADPAPVDIGRGARAAFAVGIWQPASPACSLVFDRLAADPRSRDVLFAREFDVAGQFHVNKWPEIAETRLDAPPRPGPGA